MINKEKIVLIGGGGHAKVVIDVIKENKEFDIVGILDVNENIGKNVLGIEIIGTDDMLHELYNLGVKKAFITVGSVGNVGLREKLMLFAKNIGFKFPNIISNSAMLSREISFGEGIFINRGAIINSETSIGDFVIVNSAAIVEHDVIIGKFVHISPNAVVLGNVKIGDYTHIGASSTIIQNSEIGSNVLVGMGSVVVKNIPSNVKAYGNPCRIIDYK